MKNDKLKDFLAKTAQPMPGWDAFRGELETTDWEDRRYRMRIAGLMLAYIADNGLTQQQFAEQVGCKPQYLGRVLKGKQDLRLSTMLKIQRAMGQDLIQVPTVEKKDVPTAVKETPVTYGDVVVVKTDLSVSGFGRPSGTGTTRFYASGHFNLKEVPGLNYTEKKGKGKKAGIRSMLNSDVTEVPGVIAKA